LEALWPTSRHRRIVRDRCELGRPWRSKTTSRSKCETQQVRATIPGGLSPIIAALRLINLFVSVRTLSVAYRSCCGPLRSHIYAVSGGVRASADKHQAPTQGGRSQPRRTRQWLESPKTSRTPSSPPAVSTNAPNGRQPRVAFMCMVVAREIRRRGEKTRIATHQ
jgi:hypothetical protein